VGLHQQWRKTPSGLRTPLTPLDASEPEHLWLLFELSGPDCDAIITKGLMSRTHRNVVVVALANKLARIAWAVLQRGKPFDARAVSVAP